MAAAAEAAEAASTVHVVVPTGTGAEDQTGDDAAREVVEELGPGGGLPQQGLAGESIVRSALGMGAGEEQASSSPPAAQDPVTSSGNKRSDEMLNKCLREESRRTAFTPPYKVDRIGGGGEKQRTGLSTVALSPLWALEEIVAKTGSVGSYGRPRTAKSKEPAGATSYSLRPKSAYGYQVPLSRRSRRQQEKRHGQQQQRHHQQRRQEAQELAAAAEDESEPASQGLLAQEGPEESAAEVAPLAGKELLLEIQDPDVSCQSSSKAAAVQAGQSEEEGITDVPVLGEASWTAAEYRPEPRRIFNPQHPISHRGLRAVMQQSRDARDSSVASKMSLKGKQRPRSALVKIPVGDRKSSNTRTSNDKTKNNQPSAAAGMRKCSSTKTLKLDNAAQSNNNGRRSVRVQKKLIDSSAVGSRGSPTGTKSQLEGLMSTQQALPKSR